MSSAQSERLLSLWRNKKHWHFFYAFYHCSEDPRWFVPKANPWGRPVWWLGLSLNTAHPGSWLATLIAISVVIGILYGGAAAGASGVLIVAALVAFIGAGWMLAWRAATG